MANEITLSGSLSFSKAAVTFSTTPGTPGAVGASFTNFQFNVAGTAFVQNVVSVATGGTQLDLGAVTTPHWAVFLNQDSTNYITIYNGASGAVLLRLLAGEPAICPLDPTAVPYAKANTAAAVLSYLIVAQ